jgi:hypothetical protein
MRVMFLIWVVHSILFQPIKFNTMNLEMILQMAEDVLALKPDGFDGNPDGYDSAIVGITDNGQLVYSKERMVALLVEMDAKSYEDVEDKSELSPMTTEDAWEFLEYNCFCAYVGEQTPLFVNTFENY